MGLILEPFFGTACRKLNIAADSQSPFNVDNQTAIAARPCTIGALLIKMAFLNKRILIVGKPQICFF